MNAPKTTETGYPDNNPKTAVGVSKAPLHFIPPVALVHLGLAMEDGGSKYGLMNWREFTVSTSVYYDAMLRHLLAYWDGENDALDSKVHHLGHVMACAAILLDAASTNRLNDDRPKFPGQVSAEFARVQQRRQKSPENVVLRELASSEAGGQLDLIPADANNDELKTWNRGNMPKPGTPLMRRGLRVKGSQLWFEDTVLVENIDKMLIPSAVGRLFELVDAIDGEAYPARWSEANPPEG